MTGRGLCQRSRTSSRADNNNGKKKRRCISLPLSLHPMGMYTTPHPRSRNHLAETPSVIGLSLPQNVHPAPSAAEEKHFSYLCAMPFHDATQSRPCMQRVRPAPLGSTAAAGGLSAVVARWHRSSLAFFFTDQAFGAKGRADFRRDGEAKMPEDVRDVAMKYLPRTP